MLGNAGKRTSALLAALLASLEICLLLSPVAVAGPWLPFDGLTPINTASVLEDGETLDVWILAGEDAGTMMGPRHHHSALAMHPLPDDSADGWDDAA